jgi:hypothetical protein
MQYFGIFLRTWSRQHSILQVMPLRHLRWETIISETTLTIETEPCQYLGLAYKAQGNRCSIFGFQLYPLFREIHRTA